MIPEKFVDQFAHQSGVEKLVAEREVVLTFALQGLHEAGRDADLAFKGGTCLRKVVFGSDGRFSEDLDFTLAAGLDRDDAILELLEFFRGTYRGIGFEVPDEDWYVTDRSFGGVVVYSHAFNQRGRFKLDVSFREAPTLPVRPAAQLDQTYFRHLGFAPAEVPSLHPHELLAEKLRAASQRTKVRDLFDLYTFLRTQDVDVELLRRLVVLKLWQTQDPFDPEAFFEKLRDPEDRYDWEDLRRLVRGKSIPTKEAILDLIEHRLENLAKLTDLEQEVVADAKGGWNEPLADRLRSEIRDLAAS